MHELCLCSPWSFPEPCWCSMIHPRYENIICTTLHPFIDSSFDHEVRLGGFLLKSFLLILSPLTSKFTSCHSGPSLLSLIYPLGHDLSELPSSHQSKFPSPAQIVYVTRSWILIRLPDHCHRALVQESLPPTKNLRVILFQWPPVTSAKILSDHPALWHIP